MKQRQFPMYAYIFIPEHHRSMLHIIPSRQANLILHLINTDRRMMSSTAAAEQRSAVIHDSLGGKQLVMLDREYVIQYTHNNHTPNVVTKVTIVLSDYIPKSAD